MPPQKKIDIVEDVTLDECSASSTEIILIFLSLILRMFRIELLWDICLTFFHDFCGELIV